VDVSAPGTIYVGDIVAVGASALGSTCPNPGPYRYQWTLTAPGASHAVLSSGSSPTPTFVADVAGAAYQLSVIVTDRRGNDAAVVHSSVQVSPCGDNLLLAQPDSTPNNDGTFTLRAGATDVDNNIDACPARFSQSIRYAWTIVRQPVGSTSYLTSFDSASPRLVTDAAGVYVIQVTATASNGRTATGQLVLTV
jgi:hypothetical protein